MMDDGTRSNGDPGQDTPVAMRRVTPWQIILQNKWIIALATVVGSGLGYLYYLKQVPIYESSAQVLVVKPQRSVLPVQGLDATLGYEDNLATHSLLIRSPLIVKRAIESHRLNALPSLAGARNTAKAIIGGLIVARADGGTGGDTSADVLQLKYHGTDPDECAKTLNAVIDSYQKYLGETARSVSKETLDLITEAKDNLLIQLRQKETEYRKFRQESPLLWNKHEGTNIHQARLTQIEAARSEVLLNHTQTKAQLEAMEQALRRGGNREAVALMVDKYTQDSRRASADSQPLASQIIPLLVEEQMLLEDHGPDHPKVRALERRIQVTRSYFQGGALVGGPRKNVVAAPASFLDVYLQSLREELLTADERLRQLDVLFENEREAAKAMATQQVKDETFRNDIARTQQLFDGVVKRLEEINLVQDNDGYKAQVISPASTGEQIAPDLSRIVTLASILGMFGGLALGYLRELADKSFRSPEELMGQLGVPIVGHIPFFDDKTNNGSRQKQNGDREISKLSPTLHAFHMPMSHQSEAYRTVRTALYFGMGGQDHKVIQITSPNQSDGKSTLAANLAITIAQSGRKTLLIDADLRRPRIDKLFQLDRSVGMTSVIEGKTNLDSAIQHTEIKNLSCMTSGPIPKNPSELLTSSDFEQLLKQLKVQFDFLVLDTAPLLYVSDPSAVAPRVDGVVLAVRNAKKARHDASRAADILNSLSANMLGVVVVGVDNARRYGYGSYGYGSSGYGSYGYGSYGYRYGGYRREGAYSYTVEGDSPGAFRDVETEGEEKAIPVPPASHEIFRRA